MNWKVLVNILLVILLIHFIIKNLQYARNNGHSGFEYFTNKNETKVEREIDEIKNRELPEPGPPLVKLPPKLPDDDVDKPVQTVNMNKEHFNAISFLTTPEKNYDNVFYLNNESDQVKQANVYTNDWNTANFQSNVMDLRNFFKTSPPKLSTPHRDLELQEPTLNQISNQACFIDNSNASAKTVQPDIWKYKNELPMNGGSFLQNVYGFNDDDNLFAVFDGTDKIKKQNCGPDTECKTCPDDIRGPLSTPSRKWWGRN